MNFIKSIAVPYVLKKGKRLALRWLTTTSFYKYLLKNVIPFIRISTYYTKMRGWIYHRGYALLEPGDLILTRDKAKLTTSIIGGRWSHIGMCVSKDGVYEVAEMTHKDFTKSTFADLCFEADEVAIIRCMDMDEDYIKEMISRCLEMENAKYDVQFKLGEEFLYCSELVYHSDFEKRWDINTEDMVGLGHEYVSPTAYWNAKNKEVIWLSSAERAPFRK